MAPKQETALAEYEVTQTREIYGQYRKEGEVLKLTPSQAKYYLAPYGSGLKLNVPKKEPEPRQEAIGSLDDPTVKNPAEHASGKPGRKNIL